MLQENVSLKPFNTFGIDAKARYHLRVANLQTLRDFSAQFSFRTLPQLVLGGGSNVLLLNDFEGVVLHMAIDGIAKVKEDQDYIWVQAGAGVNWHQLVLHCIAHDYAGIENLSLIPGTVGAAPIQNIGAYGVELRDVFESLEALEIRTGQLHTFDSTACAFGYRDSIFKRGYKGQYIILNVTLRLHKKPAFKTGYGAIQQTIEAMGTQELSIKAISDAVIHIRQSKLPNPAHLGNAGSFFKNPVIDEAQFKQLQAQHPQLSGYPQPKGQVKVPAAWLIEQCGWKGKTSGFVGVHKQQPLVLVNYGGGTGQAIYQLAQAIQQSVLTQFDIKIEPEVNLID